MKINDLVLRDFKAITSIDAQQFIDDVNSFTSNRIGLISSYYRNGSGSGSFLKELSDLEEEFIRIENKINKFSYQLSLGLEFFELIDYLYKAYEKILTIKNLSKWLRSSYDKNYGENKENVILRQNQSLENLSSEKGVNWEDIAVDNFVSEIDYTRDGGNVMSISSKKTPIKTIESIVDNMVGENLFGKDINRNFVFVDDDLESFSGLKAVEQAADINIRVVKGSVPEFPNVGATKSLIGSPISVIKASSLVREIQFSFKLDDIFDKVTMVRNYTVEDNVFYEFNISTKIGLTVNKTL